MISFRTAAGSLVLRTEMARGATRSYERGDQCPTCREAVSVRREPLTGHTLESCGCGTRPVRRVLSTQWVAPVDVNPFLPNELGEGRERAPAEFRACTTCGARTARRNLRGLRGQEVCVGCKQAADAARWTPALRAQMVRDYQTISFPALKKKYNAGYDTIRTLLVAEGVTVRGMGGARFSLTALRTMPTGLLAEQVRTMSIPALAAHYGVQEKYLRRELNTRRLKIPRKTRPPVAT